MFGGFIRNYYYLCFVVGCGYGQAEVSEHAEEEVAFKTVGPEPYLQDD